MLPKARHYHSCTLEENIHEFIKESRGWRRHEKENLVEDGSIPITDPLRQHGVLNQERPYERLRK